MLGKLDVYIILTCPKRRNISSRNVNRLSSVVVTRFKVFTSVNSFIIKPATNNVKFSFYGFDCKSLVMV